MATPGPMPREDWLAQKVGPAQLDLIMDGLRPLAALRAPASQVEGLIAADKPASADSAALVDLATWDPAIAANVLAAAAQQGASTRIGSLDVAPAGITQAIGSLGEEAVCMIALAALGRRWPGEDGSWDRGEFWRHCIAVALAAGLLAERAGLPVDPSEAQTWGLLHDLGKLGMLQAMPKGCLRVRQSLSGEGGGDLAAREQALLGIDHTLFGRRMAQQWRLGEALADAIWLHHLPLDSLAAASESRLRAGLVQLADTIARELGLGFAGNSALSVSSDELAAALAVPAPVVAGLRDELPAQCQRLFARLGLDLDPDTGRRAPAPAAVAEGPIERLARAGRDLQEKVAALQGRAAAMDCLARFVDARRPDEPLSEVLSGVARLVREALAAARCPRPPVVVYAIEAGEDVPAVCLRDGGEPAFRMLRGQERRAGGAPLETLPGGAVSASSLASAGDALRAMESLLEDPAQLSDWLDLARAAHVPLVSAGRRVGGVLLAGPPSAGGMAALPPLAAAAANWLGMCLELRRASARSERLAAACQDLASAQEALTQAKALAAVGEMGASAAHEINNPLAVISGRAQLMLARAGGEEEKKVWRLIVQESQRISDIISSLIELSHPPEPRLATVAAGDLLREAAGVFSSAKPPSAELVKTAPPKVDIRTAGRLPLLRADRGQIVGVLRELLTNAAAAGARRIVLAAAESPEGDVLLSVADDGAGMDAQILAAAFTPLFSHLSAGRRKGLGLAKARAVALAHGGAIWIRSEPGKGATVFVRLPVASPGTI